MSLIRQVHVAIMQTAQHMVETSYKCIQKQNWVHEPDKWGVQIFINSALVWKKKSTNNGRKFFQQKPFFLPPVQCTKTGNCNVTGLLYLRSLQACPFMTGVILKVLQVLILIQDRTEKEKKVLKRRIFLCFLKSKYILLASLIQKAWTQVQLSLLTMKPFKGGRPETYFKAPFELQDYLNC